MIKKLMIMALAAAYGVYLTGCTSSMAAVPEDLLGISIGMPRGAAESKLSAIADLERLEEGRQQIWRLNGDPHFSTIAVGYDREDRVRYVTAFVDAATAKERIAFASVGDLSKAKAEVTGRHHRYIWTHDPGGYDVNIYGDEDQFLTIYTIVKRSEPGESAAGEDDDD